MMEDMNFDRNDFKAASKFKTKGILGRKQICLRRAGKFFFLFRKQHSWIMTRDDAYEPFLRGCSFLYALFLSYLDATDYMTSMELQTRFPHCSIVECHHCISR